MPLTALRTVAKAQNGVGAYILQCKRLDFHYCDWWASSRGMNAFIKTRLSQFAKENPQIEITVSPRPSKHPVVVGTYVNNRTKPVCVRNMEVNQIMQKVMLLRNASGEKLKRITRPVKSLNESVRGVWSPHHMTEQYQI